MISIIIPLYNKGSLIERALASIIGQNYPGCEIIIVDDGSTDGSAAIAMSYADDNGLDNLRVIAQSNAGVGAARNRGIADARGEFVTFLDADDEWCPGHLDALHALTESYPQCDIFATNYENLMADGRIMPNRLNGLPFDSPTGIIDNYFVMAANSNPPLWTSAVMVRTGAIRAIGGFPVGIKSGEDLLTWARLAASHRIAYSTTPSAIYHRGHSNPRPPERIDEVGRQLKLLYRSNKNKAIPGLKHYIALWHNMRMSRCLAHRLYLPALQSLCRSLRYRPTPRIAKPLIQFTLLGLRSRKST